MAGREVLFNYICFDTQKRHRTFSCKYSVPADIDFVSNGSDPKVQAIIGHVWFQHVNSIEQDIYKRCVRCDRPSNRAASLWTTFSGERLEVDHWLLPVCGVAHHDLAIERLISDGTPNMFSHLAAAPMCHVSGPGYQG